MVHACEFESLIDQRRSTQGSNPLTKSIHNPILHTDRNTPPSPTAAYMEISRDLYNNNTDCLNTTPPPELPQSHKRPIQRISHPHPKTAQRPTPSDSKETRPKVREESRDQRKDKENPDTTTGPLSCEDQSLVLVCPVISALFYPGQC